MYLMYYLNEKGDRVYTLKVIIVINVQNYLYIIIFIYKIKIQLFVNKNYLHLII